MCCNLVTTDFCSNIGNGLKAGSYYAKADHSYTIFFWAYLGLTIATLATMVIPAVIVTIQNYFIFGEMTHEHWIVPFYFA